MTPTPQPSMCRCGSTTSDGTHARYCPLSPIYVALADPASEPGKEVCEECEGRGHVIDSNCSSNPFEATQEPCPSCARCRECLGSGGAALGDGFCHRCGGTGWEPQAAATAKPDGEQTGIQLPQEKEWCPACREHHAKPFQSGDTISIHPAEEGRKVETPRKICAGMIVRLRDSLKDYRPVCVKVVHGGSAILEESRAGFLTWNTGDLEYFDALTELAAAKEELARLQPVAFLAEHLCDPDGFEKAKLLLEDSDCTNEVITIAAIFHNLVESTKLHAADLRADGFNLRAEDADHRAAWYETSFDELVRLWNGNGQTEEEKRLAAENAALVERLGRMEAVAKYARHNADCDIEDTEFCTCGLREAIDAVRALAAQGEAQG